MTQYYIDQTATGANDGTSEADAWQSIADMVLPAGTHTVDFVAGSGIYYEQFLLDRNDTTFIGNGVEVSGGVDLNDLAYKWTASGTAGEYYLEAAAGGNPSLTEPKCGTVDKYYCVLSAEASRQMGTPGSLTFDKQFGWGDADTLGFSTVYVKLSVDPSTVEVIMASLNYVLDTPWTGNTFTGFTFSYANLSLARAHSGYVFDNCLFKYANNTCIDHNGSGEVIVKHCRSYWGGHRFLHSFKTGQTISAYNNICYESHIFALIATAADATTTMNLYGNIQYGGEAGAIDKKDADAVLNEGSNCWYPRMTAANGALGYESTANWGTTAATDIPSSTATTESSQSNLPDPKLVAVDDDNFDNVDWNLQADSPCIDTGYKWWTGANPVGIDGEPFSDFDTSMGSSQSKDSPFHPSKL